MGGCLIGFWLGLLVTTGPSPLPEGNSFQNECWAQPLKIHLSELAEFGRLSQQIVERHCAARRVGSTADFRPGQRYSVASNRLARFRLFGKELSVGVDVVVQHSSTLGQPDRIFAAPVLDLPEQWDQVIDKATYPAALIGGAAIMSVVFYEIFFHGPATRKKAAARRRR